ncbi:hypothetical protein EI94DRAFT_1698703 [Lactarius quietus]|nr:hypothetical protein EI94DRAFT_1698703 [Lactarius quietus]
MSQILLGLILELPLPGRQVLRCLVTIVHALLDFLYLAQFPSHTNNTITHLDSSLTHFHDHKDVFINLRICQHFNLPKIHSLSHYIQSICLFGTTDNYNMEQTEQLHIELMKYAFRATNHKDIPRQMVVWVECCKKVQDHTAFIKWWQEQVDASSALPIGPPEPGAQSLKMAKQPSLKAISFDDLACKYGAIDFQDAQADFITQTNHPTTSRAALSQLAADMLIPFCSVPVHHKIKFSNLDDSEIVNSIQIQPEHKDVHGHLVAAHFDMALIFGKAQDGSMHGINGNQIAQVRMVFKIPQKAIHEVFPSSVIMPPEHLAYVEWFSPIPINPGPSHLLYKTFFLMGVMAGEGGEGGGDGMMAGEGEGEGEDEDEGVVRVRREVVIKSEGRGMV